MTIKKKNAQRISQDLLLFTGRGKRKFSVSQPLLAEETFIFHAEKKEMKVY